MQATLNRNLPYMKACLNLISLDQTNNPLGSSNTIEEDEKQGADEGRRAMHTTSIRYNKGLMITAGEPAIKAAGSAFQNLTLPSATNEIFSAVNSNAKLFGVLKDYDNQLSSLKKMELEIVDMIQEQKDTYLELVRMNAESSELARIYSNTIESIHEYQKCCDDPEYKKACDAQKRKLAGTK